MRRSWWERWGPASGLLFFVFVPVLLVSAADQPGLGSSVAEVFDYHVENRSEIHAYLIGWSVALVPLVWFLGTILGALRNADGERSGLPTIGVVGLTMGVVGICSVIIFEAAAAFRPREYGPEVVRLLWDLSYAFLPVLGVGLAIFLFVVAVLTFRTGLLPRWFAWLTLVPAAGNVIYVGQLAKNDGYFLGEPGFPALVLWIPIASVLLLRATRHAQPVRRASSAAAPSVSVQ